MILYLDDMLLVDQSKEHLALGIGTETVSVTGVPCECQEEHVISIKEAQVFGFHRRFHQDEDCPPEDQGIYTPLPEWQGGRKREGEFEGPCENCGHHGSSSLSHSPSSSPLPLSGEGEVIGSEARLPIPHERVSLRDLARIVGTMVAAILPAPLHYHCLEREKSLALRQGFPYHTRG